MSAIVSVTVSQRLDKELAWLEYRVELHPSRTYTSDGNLILVSQCGKTRKHLAYIFRIRKRTHRQNSDLMFPLPNHPRQAGLVGSVSDFNVGSLGTSFRIRQNKAVRAETLKAA